LPCRGYCSCLALQVESMMKRSVMQITKTDVLFFIKGPFLIFVSGLL